MAWQSGPVIAAVLCSLIGGCGPGAGSPDDGVPPQADGLPLISEDWEILEMATAHGAFTVEVAVASTVDMERLAQRLIEPLQATYVEILVYFYDRASESELPMLRIQWTAADGYQETRY